MKSTRLKKDHTSVDDPVTSPEIKRIWVCGPPMMEEIFEKMMPEIADQFGLDFRT